MHWMAREALIDALTGIELSAQKSYARRCWSAASTASDTDAARSQGMTEHLLERYDGGRNELGQVDGPGNDADCVLTIKFSSHVMDEMRKRKSR